MNFGSFVEGPLLWIVFLIFIIGILTRLAFFSAAIIGDSKNKEYRWPYVIASFLRSLVPFHMAATKRPIYAVLRYIFHACLIIVPIWYSGHISLWEESSLEWSWTPIPDVWADWMTNILAALILYFIIRCIFVSKVRRTSTGSDWVLIILTALPFITGAMLVNANFSPESFMGRNLFTIHVLTGEAMLIMVVFLFCRTRINDQICTGCAACEINCATEALDAYEKGNQRSFTYLPYQCICCGECVRTCPEDAVELRHKINVKEFFKFASREDIRSVELQLCQRCGTPFAPVPQVEKVAHLIHDGNILFCPNCKEDEYAETLHQSVSLPNEG